MRTPLTPLADPGRDMPTHGEDRVTMAETAIASLRHERDRLDRLGLELPLARCTRDLRYWEFVRAVCSVQADSEPNVLRRGQVRP